jgi:hypothetical protein
VDSNPGGASRPELSWDGKTLAYVTRVHDKEALVLKYVGSHFPDNARISIIWSNFRDLESRNCSWRMRMRMRRAELGRLAWG